MAVINFTNTVQKGSYYVATFVLQQLPLFLYSVPERVIVLKTFYLENV